MTHAIRKYLKDFIAICVLFVIALAVAAVILSNERLTLPSWVPLVGQKFYVLKGEFSTAQAVTPGQGQTVDIAGVPVGQISRVDLVDGRAVVTMKLKEKYGEVYPNATMLLRPKTGLKDMVVELDPGSADGGKALKSGSTVPVSQTQPDVNLDEILSSLDTDSRNYLQLLVHGAGAGLKGNGQALAAAFKRFDPTARDIAAITSELKTRRRSIAHGVHAFQELATELAGKDKQLARFVDASNAVFAAFAHQDDNLRRTLQLLPGSLRDLNTAMVKTGHFTDQLGPTLGALRPGARALGPSLRQTRPFLRESTPIIRDEIRPFTREALPTVKLLRPSANSLSASTNNLVEVTRVVNVLLNELAYNPPGNGIGQEGYLFYTAWANHDANALFSNQDANGPIRRGLLLASCGTFNLLNTNLRDIVSPVNGTKPVNILLSLLGGPDPNTSKLCPSQAGAGG
jgi:phospholipid/cholesterol/gamma-HCH transport system substrate-binding protein